MSVQFNTNLTELWKGYEQARTSFSQMTDISDNVDQCEDKLRNFTAQRRKLVVAFCNCQKEAKNLLHNLRCAHVEETRSCDSASSIEHVENIVRTLNEEQNNLDDLCHDHELKLDFALQFRYYERDASETMLSMECWADGMNYQPTMQINELICLPDSTELENVHRMESAKSDEMCSNIHQIATKAQELIFSVEHSDLSQLTCDGEMNVVQRIIEMKDITQQRFHELKIVNVEHCHKLERYVKVKRMHIFATQVAEVIRNCDEKISATCMSMTSQYEVVAYHKHHEGMVRLIVEKTHKGCIELEDEVKNIRLEHGQADDLTSFAIELDERLRTAWEQLARHDALRSSLLNAAYQFHKKACEVHDALDGLLCQYQLQEDWNEKSDIDRLNSMHNEQKTNFLQACTFVRKLSKELQKHMKKNITYYPQDKLVLNIKNPTDPSCCIQRCITRVLEDLLQRENQVLNLWTNKHTILDKCIWYKSVVQTMLVWLQKTGDPYLATFQQRMMSQSNDKNEMMTSHCEMTSQAIEMLELFHVQTSKMEGKQCEKFSTNYKNAVNNRFKEFLRCMNVHKKSLITSLTPTTEHSKIVGAFDQSQTNKSSKIKSEDISDDKQVKKRNFIMTELLDTERKYVKDLEDCITYYMNEMHSENTKMPENIRDKKDVIFGNIKELHYFHSEIFLKELEKYKQLPEDLGHCFVTWSVKFTLYVEYCQNKPNSANVLIKDAGRFFEDIKHEKQLNDSIQSYLIKPVQRITKYQLLLKDLASCCKSSEEINEGLQVMLEIPKRANDAMHVSNIVSMDGDYGDVIMQNGFQVMDTKQIIRKGKDRHLFLFELSLVVCKKEVADNQDTKYFFKNKYLLSELKVAESSNTSDDSCKFTILIGRSEKLVLKAESLKIKQDWVKHLNELIQAELNKYKETSINLAKYTGSNKRKGKISQLSINEDKWSSSDISIKSLSLNSIQQGDEVIALSDQNSTDECIKCSKGEILQVVSLSGSQVFVRNQGGVEGYISKGKLKKHGAAGMDGKNSSLDLANLSLKTGKLQLNSAASIPAEKKSGFRKWLPSASRKKSTSNNNQPERNDQVEKNSEDKSTLDKSLKHTLYDEKQDTIEDESELPPPMQIVTTAATFTNMPSNSQIPTRFSNYQLPAANGSDIWEKRTDDTQSAKSSVASNRNSQDSTQLLNPSEVKETSLVSPSASEHRRTSGDGCDVGECDVTNNKGDVTKAADDVTKEKSFDEMTGEEKAVKQREYVLQELLTTEEDYVQDLETLVECYMSKVMDRGLPDPDKEQEKIIFGNILSIYEWHRDVFVKEVRKCRENPSQVGSLFKRYERRLQMYVIYCQNKPLSEYLVRKHKSPYFTNLQTEVGTKLSIADYLIKPVQRIMKYQLLLKDILKFTVRAGEDSSLLEQAVDVMYIIPKLANDMMTVGRMKSFPGRINAQGKLLLQDTFVVRELNQEKERKVFLFEQSVVLAEVVDKKDDDLQYIFKNLVKTADLSVRDSEGGDAMFKLELISRRDGSKFQLCTADKSVKDNWLQTVQFQLDKQLDFVNALQLPIQYQKSKGYVNSNNNNNNKNISRHSSFNTNNSNNSTLKNVARSITPDTTATKPIHNTPVTPVKPFPKPPIFVNDSLLISLPNNNERLNCEKAVDETVTSYGRDDVTQSPSQSDVTTNLHHKHQENNSHNTTEKGFSNNNPYNNIGVSNTVPRKNSNGSTPKKLLKENKPKHSRSKSSKLLSMNSNNNNNKYGTTRTLHSTHMNGDDLLSHKSAPDLTNGSFWLGPHSPANIKLSTSKKYIYPSSNNDNLERLNSSEESNKPLTQKRKKNTVVVAACDYESVNEDEICVLRGELLQVIATNNLNKFLVYRPPNKNEPAAEGWIPSHVLGRAAHTLKRQQPTSMSTPPSISGRLCSSSTVSSLSGHHHLSRQVTPRMVKRNHDSGRKNHSSISSANYSSSSGDGSRISRQNGKSFDQLASSSDSIHELKGILR